MPSPREISLGIALGYAKFGKLSEAPNEASASGGAAENTSVGASDSFKPSRRVREPPGGSHSNIFANDEEDDALSQAPPKPQHLESTQTRANERQISADAEPEEESGINFTSSVKPSRYER